MWTEWMDSKYAGEPALDAALGHAIDAATPLMMTRRCMATVTHPSISPRLDLATLGWLMATVTALWQVRIQGITL
jgi:hypothetical protein